jgi:hypothetical protein
MGKSTAIVYKKLVHLLAVNRDESYSTVIRSAIMCLRGCQSIHTKTPHHQSPNMCWRDRFPHLIEVETTKYFSTYWQTYKQAVWKFHPKAVSFSNLFSNDVTSVWVLMLKVLFKTTTMAASFRDTVVSSDIWIYCKLLWNYIVVLIYSDALLNFMWL